MIDRIKKLVELELVKRGVIKPKIEIEVPRDVIEQIKSLTYFSAKVDETNDIEKVIKEISESTWVTEWCKSRILPSYLRNLTIEELKTKYPELYDALNNCRISMARLIYEKYSG